MAGKSRPREKAGTVSTEADESVHTQVLRHFIESIQAGEIRVGERLLPERDLAARLKVSRPSLREVLRTLAALGIVSMQRGSGTYVVAPQAESFSMFFGLALSLQSGLSEDMLEVRIAFECEAARLAARRASSRELAAMKAALARMPRSVTGDGLGARADFAFHTAIIKGAHNPALTFMYESIEHLLKRSHLDRRKALFNEPGALARLVEAHEAIYAAIAAGDSAEAEARMREHFFIVQAYFQNMPEPAAPDRPGEASNRPPKRQLRNEEERE